MGGIRRAMQEPGWRSSRRRKTDVGRKTPPTLQQRGPTHPYLTMEAGASARQASRRAHPNATMQQGRRVAPADVTVRAHRLPCRAMLAQQETYHQPALSPLLLPTLNIPYHIVELYLKSLHNQLQSKLDIIRNLWHAERPRTLSLCLEDTC